jgi:hypothetical protein
VPLAQLEHTRSALAVGAAATRVPAAQSVHAVHVAAFVVAL